MRIMCLALAMMAVGCGDPDLDLEDIVQSFDTCPWNTPACTNSEEVAHGGIHELNLNGEANGQGIKIVTKNGRAQIFSADGTAYDLSVVEGRLIGHNQAGGVLQDGALMGATIPLLDQDGPVFDLHVRSVRTMSYPVGANEPLTVYQLTWTSPEDPVEKNICKHPVPLVADANHDWQTFPEAMRSDELLVFEGDRINAFAKTMSKDSDFDPMWFNIGCARHTLAKLRLSRNTTASQTIPNWVARQATLKLLVGDYCGTGRSFTVAGTPLRWKGGGVVFASPPQYLEARWTEQGASCVYVARLAAYPSRLFPDIRAMIAEECSLPRCTNSDFDDFAEHERVSANPPH